MEQESNGAHMGAEDALAAIAAQLSGQAWDTDTLDVIAEIVRCAGYTIKEPEQ